MKNIGFRIDTKKGVVVFKQKCNDKEVVSVSKFNPEDREFNIGVGQIIAMKRNEIKIRKICIADMKNVSKHLKFKALMSGNTTAGKMYTHYQQYSDEMIKASIKHIHELKKDLEELYAGTYAHLPQEVKDGSMIYVIENDNIALGTRPETSQNGIINI